MDEDKLLCVRLNSNYKKNMTIKPNFWCVPGGSLDDGEPLTLGLQREIIEETGVKPEIGRLLYVQQFLHNGKEHLEFFFHVSNTKDYLDIDLSKSTHGEIEIAEIAFINPVMKSVLPKFLTLESIAEHIEVHAPTKIFSYL